MSRVTFKGTRPRAFFIALALLLAPAATFAGQGGTTAGSGDGPSRPAVQSNQKERIHIIAQDHCLRVTAAGVRTRNSASPTTGGVIVLPPGPTAGSIVWAGLYWDILADGPPPNAVTLNGAAVVPVALPVTASPCWAELYAFPYFADVTALAVPGANVVAGLDDSGVQNVGPESEGASLVVIYKSTTSTSCEIIVTDGNDLTTFFGDVIDNPLPVTCPPGLPGNLWFIGGDGQGPAFGFADDQRWNGAALGDGDDFDGSDPATAGVLPDFAWDTDLWGVPVVPPFVASLTLPAVPPPPNVTDDCINWIATVLEVGPKDDPNCRPVPTSRTTWGRMKGSYR